MPSDIKNMLFGDFSKKEHFEGLFCAFEKSRCITDKKSCICPKCEIYKENNLDKLYYCTATGGEGL